MLHKLDKHIREVEKEDSNLIIPHIYTKGLVLTQQQEHLELPLSRNRRYSGAVLRCRLNHTITVLQCLKCREIECIKKRALGHGYDSAVKIKHNSSYHQVKAVQNGMTQVPQNYANRW